MMSEGEKKKEKTTTTTTTKNNNKKEWKKERIPSEQPRVSDPLMVVDMQSYAVSDVPLKKKKKKLGSNHHLTN